MHKKTCYLKYKAKSPKSKDDRCSQPSDIVSQQIWYQIKALNDPDILLAFCAQKVLMYAQTKAMNLEKLLKIIAHPIILSHVQFSANMLQKLQKSLSEQISFLEDGDKGVR